MKLVLSVIGVLQVCAATVSAQPAVTYETEMTEPVVFGVPQVAPRT